MPGQPGGNDARRQVALVTGAAQGLGHATALRLAADGFAACLKVDRIGETLLRLGTRGPRECKPLGRSSRPLVDTGHLAFARDAFATFAFVAWQRW